MMGAGKHTHARVASQVHGMMCRNKYVSPPPWCVAACLPPQVPLKYMSAFTASKYALAGLTEAVRAEVAPLGVHIGQVGVLRQQGPWWMRIKQIR